MARRFRVVMFCVGLMMFLFGTASAQTEMLIGLIPEENIFTQMDRHRPLADYLSDKLGIKVKLTILSRYGDIIDRFVSRKMDGAFFGIFTGVLAMEKLSVEPMVRPVNLDGSTTVRSYIIARKDSGIRSVRDMKGKRIVFVDRATVTGYLAAVAYFRQHGIHDIDTYFGENYFTGSNDSAIYSVLDNRADIGVVKSKVYKRVTEKDPVIMNELVILAESGPFPDTTLCLRKDLSADLKENIKKILLQMDQDSGGRDVLRKMGISKFVGADKKDFQPFFALADKAGIQIKSYRYK